MRALRFLGVRMGVAPLGSAQRPSAQLRAQDPPRYALASGEGTT